VHAALAAAAFSAGGVDAWLARDAKGFAAWRQAMEQALRAGTQDFALYSMTLRRLSDVARALGCAR
jgi:NAD-specific glutamate dehydrogenase